MPEKSHPLHTLLLVLLVACGFVFAESLSAQNKVLKVTSIQVNETRKTIDIELNATVNNRRAELSGESDVLSIREIANGREDELMITDIDPYEVKNISPEDSITLLFLIDESGSMNNENRLEKAKEAVKVTIREANLPPYTKFQLATFHDEISPNLDFDISNVDQVIEEEVQGSNKDTDLFRAIVEKMRNFEGQNGKRAIVLLSDGENDNANNPVYSELGETRLDAQDVLDKAAEMDQNFFIFPIALGNNTDTVFLKSLVDSTSNRSDMYSFTETPTELGSIFKDVVSGLHSNYKLSLEPKNCIYTGDNRTLIVNWVAEDVVIEKSYTHGSFNSAKNVCRVDRTWIYWLTLFFIGLFLLFILFAVLSLLVPLYKQREFKRKYVVSYQEENKRIKRDPVTNEPFIDGDLVVVKCKQMVALSTWEGLGNMCPNYPDCIDYLNCNGAGKKETHDNFFSQKGILKRLNWLWFGGVGGFLGWLFFVIYTIAPAAFNWYRNLIEWLVVQFIPENQIIANPNLIPSITNETFVGISIGLGLSLAIAFVEEVGESRKFSVGRIILRVFLGVFVAFYVFLFGGYLQASALVPSSFFSGLITWAIFGILFGLVLSVNSRIMPLRGMFGAFVASLIAFLIYYVGIKLFPPETSSLLIDGVKLFSYITLGSILGVIIETVIASLENFEVELLAPSSYSGLTYPISNWLKNGTEVSIGTSPKCQLYVKWNDDAVIDKHAKLTFNSNKVYIEPYEETLVNNVMVPIGEKTQLKHQDIIQMGRNSTSKFRYKEKNNDGDLNLVRPSAAKLKEAQYAKKLQQGGKPSIKIKRRN